MPSGDARPSEWSTARDPRTLDEAAARLRASLVIVKGRSPALGRLGAVIAEVYAAAAERSLVEAIGYLDAQLGARRGWRNVDGDGREIDPDLLEWLN